MLQRTIFFPHSSHGELACYNNKGTIQAPACIGTRACSQEETYDGPSYSVGPNSCNGDDSCGSNSANIGTNSCTGEFSCTQNKAAIGNGACRGLFTCFENTAEISDGSCWNQEVSSCDDLPDEEQCGEYNGACRGNSGTIGIVSCQAFNACCGNTNEIGSTEPECNTEGECTQCTENELDNDETTSNVPPATKTKSPTSAPSYNPTYIPSYVPTKSPTYFPSYLPTKAPQ